MARPAKADLKAKESATVVVNIDDFVRTRDSVVTGLATLQSAVQDLSHAYIAHTNTVLGRAPGTSLSLLGLANPLENGLLAPRPASPLTKADTEEPKKKRKRAPHDPNAPKRALTPYFLYMQTARSKIAQELGATAKPKDVADEGTRRWASMPEPEKKIWHVQYSTNLAAYREKMAAYKAGKLDGEAAQQLLSEQGASAGAIDPVVLSEDEEEEEEEEPTPEPPKVQPPKAPTPTRTGQNKRRKTAAEAKAAPTPAKEAPVVSKKEEKAKSPEKKKKSKKDKEAEAEKPKKVEVAKAEATPKDKKGRKKRRSEAIDT